MKTTSDLVMMIEYLFLFYRGAIALEKEAF